MKTLYDLMTHFHTIEHSGSVRGFDRYEVEPGVYALICPECGYILTTTPDAGCIQCGFGSFGEMRHD